MKTSKSLLPILVVFTLFLFSAKSPSEAVISSSAGPCWYALAYSIDKPTSRYKGQLHITNVYRIKPNGSAGVTGFTTIKKNQERESLKDLREELIDDYEDKGYTISKQTITDKCN